MSSPVNLHDFEVLAQQKLPKMFWDFIKGGAANEVTLRDNSSAFQRYRLRPYVLNDVSRVNLSTTVLGSKISFPVCIAPVGVNQLAHVDKELAVAKAAASHSIGYTMSMWSTTSIEDVAKATANSLKWMQLYMHRNREESRDVVRRAERNGYQAIFLTIDTQVAAIRYRNMKNRFAFPTDLSLANFTMKGDGKSGLSHLAQLIVEPALQWSDVAWLKSITKLPVVLKGILTAEMAKKAVEYGVDGIVVSNHGARQLDGVPATIDALAEVVKAVDGRCEVYLDGGVTCGTDVLKAIGLGARAVFVGRAAMWGLAVDGEEGVKSVLTILRNEFQNAMQLMGCRSIEELQNGVDLVVPQSYYKSHL